MGEIQIGTKTKTIINVAYDTGSDWLVVPDISCGNCIGNKVNNTDSGKIVNNIPVERTYGSVTMIGTTWTNTVCLSSSTWPCV